MKLRSETFAVAFATIAESESAQAPALCPKAATERELWLPALPGVH